MSASCHLVFQVEIVGLFLKICVIKFPSASADARL